MKKSVLSSAIHHLLRWPSAAAFSLATSGLAVRQGRRALVKTTACLLLVMGLLACNEEEPEPLYLQLNGVEFSTSAGQGAPTADIASVWVFIDNEFFGAFRPDARVPMLVSGTQEVRFEFGIQENGQSITPNIYEFYQPVTRTIEAIPGETIEIATLPVRYKSDVNFAFIEGFESNEERVFNFVLEGETSLEQTTASVRSGQSAGVIELERGSSTVFAVASQFSYDDLIGEIGQVWLEVDYRSDAPVVFGIVEALPSGVDARRFFDPGFVARSEWTKVYFNLTEVIVNSQLTEYRFGLTAFLNDLEQDSGTIYLDNLKVLYF